MIIGLEGCARIVIASARQFALAALAPTRGECVMARLVRARRAPVFKHTIRSIHRASGKHFPTHPHLGDSSPTICRGD